MLVLLASGCMARLGEGSQGQNNDGDSTAPDASVPSTPDAGAAAVDAAPDGNSYLASCMAKGYTTGPAGVASLYRTSSTDRTWTNAAAECNADVPGSTHLVVLSAQAEVDFIKTKRGWIGLSDRATEGTFVNATLEPGDMRPFLSGQPDNGSGAEDCVQMKADGLDDDQCDNAHVYVCECDGRAPM